MEVVENDTIDIKKLFFNIYDYKWVILVSMFIFGLGGTYYSYFLPNVYRAVATVKVGVDDGDYAKDVISIAMGNTARNTATEKDLILSRSLANKALKYVNFKAHYYQIKNYKSTEIYKRSPIKVSMIKGYGILFDIEIIDENSYRLILKDSSSFLDSTVRYDNIHSFGTFVKTDYFEFLIQAVSTSDIKHYQFSIDRGSKVFGTVSVQQGFNSSTVLKISVEDTVARRATEYANALAKAYVQLNIENKMQEASERLSFIDNQLTSVSSTIEVSDGHLENFRKESKIVNIEHSSASILERLEKYESELMELNIREVMLDSLYSDIKAKKKLETLSIEGIEARDSILAEIMKRLQEALVKQKVLSQDYTNLHPALIKVNKEISQLKRSIKNTVKNLVLNLDKRKSLLLASITKQNDKLQSLPQNERKFGRLERNFKMNEEIKAYLLKQQSEAKMVRESKISKNQILDFAILPFLPIKPKRMILILMSIFLGFAFGLSWAIIRIFMDTKVQTESDITGILSYPILGTIPHINEVQKTSERERIKVFESVKSSTAESFRHIRSNLEFLRKKKGPQVILLTSTVGREGKTTLTVNLAAIMSLSLKRTIILNLDFRKPTLHE
jgi:uncharacterized protein involved in exopolysaccharide biosynthesis